MTTPSNALRESAAAQGIAPMAISATRPMYWSMRCELWENRSILVAPLVVAAVVLFGLVSIGGLPRHACASLLLDPAHQRAAIGMPYDTAAMMILMTALFVGARAHPRLAATDLRLGAACDHSVGRASAARALHLRDGCVPHVAFRVPAEIPPGWLLHE